MTYEPIIGLEIHAELNTKTKMFCFSKNDPDEKHPNLNICPVCMGHPGTLPVINQEAVKKVIQVGLALEGRIAEFSQFDRKNYFYPDLPKGYQISQYAHPLVQGGVLELSGGKKIRIRRIHLEEDTGRLLHDPQTDSTLVDFNRAGVPLMELVTEPDLRSGEEVREFGEKLRQILRYLEASNADMEKGELRMEVNISLRQRGTNDLGTKVEIKNINSFRFAAEAVDYEIERQSELLNRGEKVVQETRGWDENKKETFSQRSKEEAHDYRYFPEPDLPPLKIPRELVEELRRELPELPAAKADRFVKEYGFAKETALILSANKSLAAYTEAVISEVRQHVKEAPEKPAKNAEKTAEALLSSEFLHLLNKTSASADEVLITPENFAELALYLAEGKISNLAAKEVLKEMFQKGGDPSEIINRLGLWQLSETADLENIVEHIVSENPKAVEDYKKGKEAALQFLVGQVMKDSRGTANPKIVREVLLKVLKK